MCGVPSYPILLPRIIPFIIKCVTFVLRVLTWCLHVCLHDASQSPNEVMHFEDCFITRYVFTSLTLLSPLTSFFYTPSIFSLFIFLTFHLLSFMHRHCQSHLNVPTRALSFLACLLCVNSYVGLDLNGFRCTLPYQRNGTHTTKHRDRIPFQLVWQ